MTIGISKEELVRLKDTMTDGNSKLFMHALIVKCKELDPWMPIENAPKDRLLLLFVKHTGYIGVGQNPTYTIEGRYNKNYECWDDYDYNIIKPTHWKELPEDPKE